MAAICLDHVTKNFQTVRPLPFWPGGAAAIMRPLAESIVRRVTAPARTTVEEESAAAILGYQYRARVLDDVSIDIQNGETMSVIGPSGCGKTTLLRLIAGLVTPDKGQVFYDGHDMATVLPKDRRVGMVFQNYALYPHMKGKGNLAFFFRMHHRENEIDEMVRITAQMMGIGFADLLDRHPRTLSGGQKQRVAIARCIVRNPALFLFDEPLSSLDAKLRAQTRVEIKRLLGRFHITSIYVTHDQVEAIALADRIAVMREGRIEQVGTYRDIYDYPVNMFVASFVGSPTINLFPINIDSGHLVLSDGQSIDIPSRLAAVTNRSSALSIGVRSEHIKVSDLSCTEGLLAQIEVVENLPSDRAQLVHLRTRGWKCIARVPQSPQFQPEQWVRLSFNPEYVLAFDSVTERRVS
jgi:ABC-type sugar transport system ATPase subunit